MDNVKNFHLWDRWEEIVRFTQIAVFDINCDLHSAMKSKFATRFHLKKDFAIIPAKKKECFFYGIKKGLQYKIYCVIAVALTSLLFCAKSKK